LQRRNSKVVDQISPSTDSLRILQDLHRKPVAAKAIGIASVRHGGAAVSSQTDIAVRQSRRHNGPCVGPGVTSPG
jgi:hypothetical protein